MMWARIVTIIVGLWIMAAPGIFAYGSAASDNGHITGPVIATFATIACWDATRGVRRWNYPLGIWLLLAPWILGYDLNIAIISDMICGALVLLLASVKGKKKGKFGGGWSVLWE